MMVMQDVRAATILVVLAGALVGCSTLERANPVSWFDDDKPKRTGELPTDEPYPNLADVPGRPVRPPALERDKITRGLAADRENAQYTEETLRRVPEAPLPRATAARPATPASPSPSTASTPPAPAAPSPPAIAEAPSPAPAAAPQPEPTPAAPPPPAPAAAPPPAPAAPPPDTAAAPVSPAVAPPPASAYARPADVPVDPAAPSGEIVNNQPVVTPGFFGTQPPPAAAQVQQAQVAPTTQLDPLRTVIAAPPPPPAAVAPAAPNPIATARAETPVQRATEPEPAAPPPAPTAVTPIPNAVAPAPAAPSRPPPGYVPSPAATGPLAAVPSTERASPPERLDEALRREFPAPSPRRGPSQGIQALAATIYFAEGSAGLSEDDRMIVREVARLHRERGGAVRVVGYASADGRSANLVKRGLANLDIATRRADTVSRELARFGVASGAITTSAEGATAGPGPGSAGLGPAGERRVDIYLDY
jgi:outer membrane protein OmpA-like peptidoglycan-associated protein